MNRCHFSGRIFEYKRRGEDMFQEMRRKDRAITEEEAWDLLKEAEYGVLSTVNEDGYPYGVPLSPVVVDGAVYIHCAKQGQKADNLRRSDKVCFTAVGKTQVLPGKHTTLYESAVVFGTVREANEEERLQGLRAVMGKYSPGAFETEDGQAYMRKLGPAATIFIITVEQITGKAKRKA